MSKFNYTPEGSSACCRIDETTSTNITDPMLTQYSRQMILSQVGSEGQQKILASKVLLVGVGGIGSTVAMYLSAAGVSIDILDFDVVEVSNLHRQIIHEKEMAGVSKTASALKRINAINPNVNHKAFDMKLTVHNAEDIFKGYELVIDATDNFGARYIINDTCVLLGIPLISGSAVGMEGQITTIIPRNTPCYRCLYPKPSVAESCRSCANAGVLGPVPGMIGCLQATEALKFILLKNKPGSMNSSFPTSSASEVPHSKSTMQLLLGRQIFYDGTSGEFFTFELPPRNPSCEVCGIEPKIVSLSTTQEKLDELASAASEAKYEVDKALGDFNQMSALEYNDSVLLQSNLPHLLIDVRSTVQYGMITLRHERIAKCMNVEHALEVVEHLIYSSNISSSSSSNNRITYSTNAKCIMVNIPLVELQGGVAGSSKRTKREKLLSDLAKLHREIARWQQRQQGSESDVATTVDSSKTAVAVTAPPIFVLCRRGIDSQTATMLLIQEHQQQQQQQQQQKQAQQQSDTESSVFLMQDTRIYNILGGLQAWSDTVDPTFPKY